MDSSSRKLTVRKRPRPQTSFVRLGKQTARALWQDALAKGAQSSSSSLPCWTVAQEKGQSAKVNSGIEFLPLEIKSQDEGTIVYASYNGGDIDEENAIEIPEFLLPHQSEALVRVIPYVLHSNQVVVETVSPEGWAMLQQHADWLENGGFLDQISLVYRDQIVSLALPDGIRADIRVVSVEKEQESVWPNSEPSNEDSDSNCRRILADTEVVLLPGSTESVEQLPVLKIQPAREEYSSSMQELHALLDGAPPLESCPFGMAVFNPDDWPTENKYARIHPKRERSNNFPSSYLVEVKVSGSVAKGHSEKPPIDSEINWPFMEIMLQYLVLNLALSSHIIVLHPLIRISLGLSLCDGRISVEEILQIEWNQVTQHTLSIESFISVSSVQLLSSEGSFRQPSLVATMASTLTDESACHTGFVPCESVVVVQLDDRNQPELFKIVPKTERSGQGYRNDTPMYPAEDIQSHIRSENLNMSNAPEQIVVHDPNLLPKACIFPEELRKLKPFVQQDGSFVLVGKNGSGKTHSALIVATMCHFLNRRHVVYLDCKALKNLGRMMDILDAIRDTIEDAWNKNAMLILDDLDELVVEDHLEITQKGGAQVQQPNWMEMEQSKLIGDHIQHLLVRDERSLCVVVTSGCAEVAVSVLPDDVDPTLIHLPLLRATEKLDLLLNRMQRQFRATSGSTLELIKHECASLDFEGTSRSFLPIDLCTFTSRLQKHLELANKSETIRDILQDELDRFVPINRAAAATERVETQAVWDEVGGLYVAKEKLLDTVFRPSKYRQIYQNAGIRLPRGILLYGPSGCGKTYIVPALASYCRLPLVMCRGPELLDRYIGGSEAKVRELFSRAFLAAPCILFLDEFDALAPKRGSDSTGVTDRVVNQLLTFLDGVEDFSASSVYIIATTSRPDRIDPALLRPGRLEKHIHVGLPESSEEMMDVIRKVSQKYAVAQNILDRFCASFDWASKELSPADVRAGFQTAHILALRSQLEGVPNSAHEICIDESHLQEAFSSLRKSLSSDDAAYYARMRDRFEKGTSPRSEGTNDNGLNNSVILRTALK